MNNIAFICAKIQIFYQLCLKKLEWASPVIDLAARLYVSRVFLLSGWNKLSDWPSTLYLFTSEYDVPLLPPLPAALLATAGELTFGLFLLFGIFTQFSAFGLFLVNLVAVISYYDELVGTPAAIHDHIEWGIILALIMSQKTHPLSLGSSLGKIITKIRSA
jgi:putative oxidoreductase